MMAGEMVTEGRGAPYRKHSPTEMKYRAQFPYMGKLFQQFFDLCLYLQNVPFGVDFLMKQEDTLSGYINGKSDIENTTHSTMVVKWFNGELGGDPFDADANDDILFKWVCDEAVKNGTHKTEMTLAAFKRLVSEKAVSLEVIWHYGKEGSAIPKRIQGIRRVLRAASYGFDMEVLEPGENGNTVSQLRISHAAQFCVEDGKLYVFNAGVREATLREQAAIDAWTEKLEKDAANPAMALSNPYWSKKKHFMDYDGTNYSYIPEAMQYKRLGRHGNDLLRDKKVRGALAIVYKIHVNNPHG